MARARTEVEDDLARLVARRVAVERQIEQAVVTARSEGVPWSLIASGLGVSKQAAQQRYGR